MQHKVFENEEIRNIYTALGVTIGTEEDIKFKFRKTSLS